MVFRFPPLPSLLALGEGLIDSLGEVSFTWGCPDASRCWGTLGDTGVVHCDCDCEPCEPLPDDIGCKIRIVYGLWVGRFIFLLFTLLNFILVVRLPIRSVRVHLQAKFYQVYALRSDPICSPERARGREIWST